MYLFVIILQYCLFLTVYASGQDDQDSSSLLADTDHLETTKISERLTLPFRKDEHKGQDKTICFSHLGKCCCVHGNPRELTLMLHITCNYSYERVGSVKRIFKHIKYKANCSGHLPCTCTCDVRPNSYSTLKYNTGHLTCTCTCDVRPNSTKHLTCTCYGDRNSYNTSKNIKHLTFHLKFFYEGLFCNEVDILKVFCDNFLLTDKQNNSRGPTSISLRQLKHSDYSQSISFKHRKLLHISPRSVHKADSDPGEKIQIWDGGIDQGTYKLENSSFNGLTVQQWKHFLDFLDRKMSKDHIWAMLSLVFLVVMMMLAMKVCGLKPIDRSQERHLDHVFQENDHTISIREIIALKKPYLPRYIVEFSKKWRWRRKKKTVKVKPKECDIADPISDNSDDERLIYSQRIVDF